MPPFNAADAVGKSPSPWPAIIGSVAGGAIDAWSQNQANKANAKNVQKQIDFQKQQSETQYQRAVADMGKAGLNPALAYQQGGNATQSGAAATREPLMRNTAQRLSTAVQVYNDMAGGIAQRRLLNAQTDNTNANTAKTDTERNILQPDLLTASDLDYRGLYNEYRKAKLRGDTFTATKTPERFAADLANLGAGTARAQAAAAEAASRTTLNEQQFFPALYRAKIAPYINAGAHALAFGQNAVDLINPLKNIFGKDIPKELKSFDETRTFGKGYSHTSRTYRK